MGAKKETTEGAQKESTRAPIRVVSGASETAKVGDRLLTERDVCAITGLDRVTLYRLRNSHKIGFYKLGKVIRYSLDRVANSWSKMRGRLNPDVPEPADRPVKAISLRANARLRHFGNAIGSEQTPIPVGQFQDNHKPKGMGPSNSPTHFLGSSRNSSFIISCSARHCFLSCL